MVSIRSRNGEVLYGILASPVSEKSNKKNLIIFSQVGVVAKTGMGDHLRILADNLASEGFTTLRFDQSGTGDSFGEITSGISIPQFFRQVQGGLFKNDTLDVIDWTLNEFSDYRIFLFGECGGCISSVMACAERTYRVAGLALLAMPVLLYPLGNDDHKEIRGFDAQIISRLYLRKVFNPKAYVRVLFGRSDLKLIRLISLSFFKRYYNKALTYVRLRKAESTPDHKRFNWRFWEAFEKVIKTKIPIIFLMPELDNETFEFNSEFKEKVLDREDRGSNCWSITYLSKTDHSIMFQKSRDYLFQQLVNWLDRI